MWDLTPGGCRSGHGKVVRGKSQKSISVLSKKGKEGREYDTERRSLLFFLSPVLRWGLITTSQPEALSLLQRQKVAKRECQIMINSEVKQKKPGS